MTNGDQFASGGSPWRIGGRGFAAALILAPSAAMRLSTAVNWTLFDFASAGAVITKARPAGMARAIWVAAAAQALAGLFVLVAGIGSMQPPGPLGPFALIEFLTGLSLGSAMLFRLSARQA